MEKTNNTVTKLLTVAEVCEELRVTRGTAYRWIRDGNLPAPPGGHPAPIAKPGPLPRPK
jgi:hypothetical protein